MSIPAVERKTVLDLFPYFNQKHPVVFDVGSNKGDFAEVFVNNVAEIHLFEPNELLLHYSMVRFCDKRNVMYIPKAVSYQEGMCSFWQFNNENNGLSNVFNNPRWKDLPGNKKEIETITLDWYAAFELEIDLLKIDVEGAEMLVLKGCYNRLLNKQIKIIQIEKAEHIHLSGYTFDDVVDYLATFGYSPLETEDKENVIFAMSNFTQNWNTEFIKNTEFLKGKVLLALEIGCFEGLTSRYICDNLLDSSGRMICVDPLTDEYLPGHPYNHMFAGQYDRFTRNTKGYPIELVRKKSVDAYEELRDYGFNFIYIDGDHTEDTVFTDGVKCFQMLLEGGYMLFDDYFGYSDGTTRGIERFLETQTGNYEVISKGYQLLIQKKDWSKVK